MIDEILSFLFADNIKSDVVEGFNIAVDTLSVSRNIVLLKFLKEFRLAGAGDLTVGSEVKADVFTADDYVDVTANTKGRGFQGVVKRWNFGGGRASHGGAWERRPGSIGCREWPGNVIKGKKMPGHMGNVRRTVQNLKVVRVMADENVLLVRGAIPGPNGGMVIVKQAVKKG